VTFDALKKQIELLRLRRQASRIAVQLYEVATNQTDIDTINVWFDQCNHAKTRAEVQLGIDAMLTFAHSKNLTIDL
jgi:hypothetical protein